MAAGPRRVLQVSKEREPYRTELTPVAFLRRSAYVFPDKTAVVHGERRYTYAQFEERVNRLASGLRGLGLLVARVWFVSAEGEWTESEGLAGRFVEATDAGFRPTSERFSAVMSAVPFVDPHDGADIDTERDERGEVAR